MKKIIKVVTMILISLSAVAAFPDAAFSKDKPYVSKKLAERKREALPGTFRAVPPFPVIPLKRR